MNTTNPQVTVTPLIAITDGTPTTTSLIIADGVKNPHETVIRLIRNYCPDLEEFGRVRFEIGPFATNGGTQQREFAILNERQATLIMTYMRNTAVVREFKKQLVKAFYQLAESAKQAVSTPALAPTPKHPSITGKATRIVLSEQAAQLAELTEMVKALAFPSVAAIPPALPAPAPDINYPVETARATDGDSWVTYANTVGDKNWQDPLWNLLLKLEDMGCNVDGCKAALRVRDLLTMDACRAAASWGKILPRIHVSRFDGKGKERSVKMVASGMMMPKERPYGTR
ncbi:MAG: Rha family transcriptional regulator [Magnetococcus sp. YQC-5]